MRQKSPLRPMHETMGTGRPKARIGGIGDVCATRGRETGRRALLTPLIVKPIHQSVMRRRAVDPISPWFVAAEELGEYIGIRFGQAAADPQNPQWIFLPHTGVDGIGGLADILRRRGAEVSPLAQIKHHSGVSWLSLLRSIPKYVSPRHKVEWASLSGIRRASTKTDPPTAVGWHVFDETATTQIRKVCRKAEITVNSFLLKHLTKAIRPFLKDQAATVPWMVPVNLRGGVSRERDIENHSSYVGVKVHSYDTVHDVHRAIYQALARGEHWANWFAYRSGLLLTAGMRRYMIAIERCMSQWNIGSFSNLGDWDPEKQITQLGCEGPWLFTPPVLRCQLVGAGCLTFQNRLSLTIQVHPELTIDSEVPKAWVHGWVKEIEIDLASVLALPASVTWAV